jgi:hypothetical protein
MKKRMIFIIFMATLFNCFANAKLLYEGEEMDSCYESAPDDIHDQNTCLSDETKISNQRLDELISVTSKRIKATVLGPFAANGAPSPTLGEVYSQRFLDAQVIWKRYRTQLCLAVAGQLYEDTMEYSRSLDQCEINLNKRHMAEIRAMGVEKAD